MTARKFVGSKNPIILTAAATALSLLLASGMMVQPAFAHALNIASLNVEGAGERQVTIVLGHTDEPTFGAKPGIHDGKHNVEVFLEDTATALPISGADLKVDKYYFKDFVVFENASSVENATEIESGVALDGVFGDPGHYEAKQVQEDGIYGYRLYGTIHYFGVAELEVDSTVFCETPEGNTTKFNSDGWFGGYGCAEDIDDILFPENGDVSGNGNATASSEAPGAESEAAVQGTSASGDGFSATQATSLASIGALELLVMVGLPAAAVAGFVGIRSYRGSRRDSQL